MFPLKRLYRDELSKITEKFRLHLLCDKWLYLYYMYTISKDNFNITSTWKKFKFHYMLVYHFPLVLSYHFLLWILRSQPSLLPVCSWERFYYPGRGWLQWRDGLCRQVLALEPSKWTCGSLTKKGTLQESWHRDFQWPATAPAALYTAATNSVTLFFY